MKQRRLDFFFTERQNATSERPSSPDRDDLFTRKRPRGHQPGPDETLACLPPCRLLHKCQGGCAFIPPLLPFANATAQSTRVLVTSPASPPEMSGRTAVLSMTLDRQEDYAVVLQKSRASVYSVASWMAEQPGDGAQSGGSGEAVVSLSFDAVRDRTEYAATRTGGFSSLAFCGDSLFVATAYTRFPFVDLFDLEDVDEAAAHPTQRFDLSRIENTIAASSARGPSLHAQPCGTDVCPLTEQVSVCGLSDGRAVWLDRRKRYPHTLLSGKTVNMTLGQSLGTVTSPSLTAVAKVGDMTLMTGAVNGTLKLWDIRSSSAAIAEMHVGAEVGSICPVRNCGTHSDRCGARTTWISTRSGRLLLISTGATGMEVVTSADTEDKTRSSTSINMGSPKAVYCEAMELLLYPHFASNSLFLCEGRVEPTSTDFADDMLDLSSTDNDDDDSTPYHGGEVNALAESVPHFTTALQLYGSKPPAPAAALKSAEPSTRTLRTREMMTFPADFTVAACAAIERLETILIGDAFGNVRLCGA